MPHKMTYGSRFIERNDQLFFEFWFTPELSNPQIIGATDFVSWQLLLSYEFFQHFAYTGSLDRGILG